MPPLAAAAATARMSAGPVHADIAADSVDDLQAVALAERVGDFNISMDPWEQTGATSRLGGSRAPDGDSCAGIYSAATSRHYSPLLWEWPSGYCCNC